MLKKELNIIKQYYKTISKENYSNTQVEITNKILIENKINIINSYKTLKNSNIYINKKDKIYTAIDQILINNNYKLDFNILVKELNKNQYDNNYFYTYKQLDEIKSIIFFLVIKKIATIFEYENKKIIEKNKIKNVIQKIKKSNYQNTSINTYYPITPESLNENLFFLHNELKKLEKNSYNYLQSFYLSLENIDKKISTIINEVTKKEAETYIITKNIFKTIINIQNINQTELYSNISNIEKVLNKDEIYKKMNSTSKNIYRKKLTTSAKKEKRNLFEYTNKLINNKEHIGIYLFPKQNKNYKILLSYIIILLLSITLAIILQDGLTNNKIINILILLLPIIELFTYISKKLFKKKYLFRIDYEKNNIPDDSKTMVIVTTTKSNIRELENLYYNMENIYLTNTNNLYFTLLIETNTKDKENIISYNNNICTNLNSKYKKNIFNYIYTTKSYKLMDLNKLLLNKINKNNQFTTNLPVNINIKYVITLNSNIKIDNNQINQLIGIMDHPLNKITLNNNYKVTDGICILQPNIKKENKLQKDNFFDPEIKIYNLKSYYKVISNLPSINNNIIDNTYLLEEYLNQTKVYDISIIKKASTPLKYINYQKYKINNNIEIIKYIKNNKNTSLSLLNYLELVKNINRDFVNSNILLIIIISLLLNKNTYFFLIFCFIIANLKENNLFYKNNKIILNSLNEFLSIPTYTYTFITSYFFKSKRKIQTSNNTLIKYIKIYFPNIVLGIIMSIIYIKTKQDLILIIGILYILTPLISFIASKKLKEHKKNKNNIESKEEKKLVKSKNIRTINELTTINQIAILSNAKYTLLIDDKGNSISKYKNTILNYYKTITENNYGQFIYIKNLEDNTTWSNTYSPINKYPTKYEVSMQTNEVKFIREDNDITTTTTITLSPVNSFEIRKITLKNNSKVKKSLQITTYLEYKKDFDELSYDEKTNSIIVHNKNGYLINKLLIENNKMPLEYITNKKEFIGTGRSLKNPKALEIEYEKNWKNNNKTNDIISFKSNISIKPNQVQEFYLITGFEKSKEELLNTINIYNNKREINKYTFEIFPVMNDLTNKELNFINEEIPNYNTLINYLYQTNKINITEAKKKLLMFNKLNLDTLKKFNLSENIPIILLDIENKENIYILYELLQFFKYYKSKNLSIDLVILNSSNTQFANSVNELIKQQKYYIKNIINMKESLGNLYIIDTRKLTKEEIILLYSISRFAINANECQSLKTFIEKMQNQNIKSKIKDEEILNNIPIKINKEDLKFFNEFGGFEKDGKNYTIINQNTPNPWINILANYSFGEIITNSHNSYTKKYGGYNLTENNTENYIKNENEGILINDYKINFQIIKYSFGKSTYITKTDKMDIKLTKFISSKEEVKFYKLQLKNNTQNDIELSIKYFILPVLGNKLEENARHIVCEYKKENNIVTMQNRNNSPISNIISFITSTEKISNTNLNEIPRKEIEIKLNLKKETTKELAFTIGCCNNYTDLYLLKEKYSNITTINNTLKINQNYWYSIINRLEVNTPNLALNYILNGWCLYQIITTNYFKKEKELLSIEDSINICTTNPEYAKEIILNYQNITTDKELIFISLLNKYLKTTANYSILDINNIYEYIKNIIEKHTKAFNDINNIISIYIAMNDFLEIIKIYNKNINTKKYKEIKINLETEIINYNWEKVTDLTLIAKSIHILKKVIEKNRLDKIIKNIKKETLKQTKKNPNLYHIIIFIELEEFELAYQYYELLNPINKTKNKKDTLKYKDEPYIIQSNNDASLFYKIGIETFLGIERNSDILYIKPKLPKTVNSFTLKYTYLNTNYIINIKTNQKKNKLLIDDIEQTTSYIKLKNSYKTHKVEIYKKNN